MSKNPHTSFRLSGEGRELLALLGKFYGLSMTAVLELLIRERADAVVKREGDTEWQNRPSSTSTKS